MSTSMSVAPTPPTDDIDYNREDVVFPHPQYTAQGSVASVNPASHATVTEIADTALRRAARTWPHLLSWPRRPTAEPSRSIRLIYSPAQPSANYGTSPSPATAPPRPIKLPVAGPTSPECVESRSSVQP